MNYFKRIIVFISIFYTFYALANITQEETTNPFNFSYNITGVLNISPTQVFDDGQKTYFQFESHQEIPSIFLDQPAGLTLLPTKKEGALLYSVMLLGNSFVTILKNKRAYITYYGGARAANPIAIFYPTDINSPLKKNDPLLTTEGNVLTPPIQDFNEDCILCHPTPPTLKTKHWEILFSDHTLKNMLERWSIAAGYHLVWQIDRHFPIEAESIIEGDLLTALRAIATSLAMTDYPIKIFFHESSRLIRVVPYHHESLGFRRDH